MCVCVFCENSPDFEWYFRFSFQSNFYYIFDKWKRNESTFQTVKLTNSIQFVHLPVRNKFSCSFRILETQREHWQRFVFLSYAFLCLFFIIFFWCELKKMKTIEILKVVNGERERERIFWLIFSPHNDRSQVASLLKAITRIKWRMCSFAHVRTHYIHLNFNFNVLHQLTVCPFLRLALGVCATAPLRLYLLLSFSRSYSIRSSFLILCVFHTIFSLANSIYRLHQTYKGRWN